MAAISKERIVRRYKEVEDDAVKRFRNAQFFKQLKKFPDEQVKRYLLQRFFMSKNFVPWYRLAESSITNEAGKRFLDEIIAQEICSTDTSKSHFNNLIRDLLTMGMTVDQIRSAQPSKVTMDTIRLFQALAQKEAEVEEPDAFGPSIEKIRAEKRYKQKITSQQQRQRDLEILVGLRVAGEILVSEEYGFVIPDLERRFGLTRENSLFFYPHYEEDKKEGGAHSTGFLGIINHLMGELTQLDPLVLVVERATDARMHFFMQTF